MKQKTEFIVQTRNSETGKIESVSRITKSGKIAAGILAVSAVLGVHQGLNALDEHNKKTAHMTMEYDDFAKYNLANQPKELAKIYKKEGIGPNDVTFYTVKNEPTAYDVAKDMGIYNWGEVTNEIISPQVNNSESNAHWTMHPGEVVVVPKDLFGK